MVFVMWLIYFGRLYPQTIGYFGDSNIIKNNTPFPYILPANLLLLVGEISYLHVISSSAVHQLVWITLCQAYCIIGSTGPWRWESLPEEETFWVSTSQLHSQLYWCQGSLMCPSVKGAFTQIPQLMGETFCFQKPLRRKQSHPLGFKD